MDNEIKYTTSLRLYKKRPIHDQAHQCLKGYNKDIFKTKDDFIAEAIIYFDRYLKQKKEVQQMELLNTYMEGQKGQFIEMIKEAVRQINTDSMADFIKEAVAEAMEGHCGTPFLNSQAVSERYEEEMEDSLEKDLKFAQFYDDVED